MRIKKPNDGGNKIQSPLHIKIDYPVFCFKHLQWSNIQKGDGKLLKVFVERAQKLENLGWNEIQTSDRHSYGMEQIPIKMIKPQLPSFVSPDVKHLIAFRYTGNNLPFLALRNGNILHIIFIETQFGDIYDHGSKKHLSVNHKFLKNFLIKFRDLEFISYHCDVNSNILLSCRIWSHFRVAFIFFFW